MKKRFVALLMTLALAIGFTTSAFAAEPTKSETINLTSVSEEVDSVSASEDVSTRSAGKQLASNATTIYGGNGSLSVYLPSGNFWADLQVKVGYTDTNSLIMCSVLTPNGEDIYLGAISGTGSSTSLYELGYAPAGTYIFSFTSAIQTPYEMVAYIYD